MKCADRYVALKESLRHVTLVAVSKKRTVDEIKALYDVGCRDFGENRIDEALDKKQQLPTDIRWHFIGALQRKKTPKVIDQFYLIHSVDSLELAKKLVGQRVLLQVNISQEVSKRGFAAEELRDKWLEINELDVDIAGLMTMAPLTQDQEVIRHTFRGLKQLNDELGPLPELSMGMSHDYPIAVEEGATIVRLGSAIFG